MMLAVLVAAAASLVTVSIDAAHQVNTIRPLRALGVGIDSDPPGKIALLYAPKRTRRMLAAGLGSLSYRLYTELSIQDWHWNPRGRYSDAPHRDGYWTSDDVPATSFITDSFGYRLPHRGSTRDQGDDSGYSRMDDGDASTYWKSDPYLTHAYTHEADALHPQWAVIDLERSRMVDAIRVAWARPYATRYAVQYWTGGDAIQAQASGRWHTFEHGDVRRARGETATTRLAPVPRTVRFVRVLMWASSGTCDSHGAADRRDCMGYAIREIGLGTYDRAGSFRDVIRHAPCGGNPEVPSHCGDRQTTIFASSVDPWHRDDDRVRNDQEQPGLDFVARNPIARGLPVMYAVPLFYSTPENAAAEVRYLAARHYPVAYVEMGEEVDGQYAMPEDYGALYLQAALKIHAANPNVRLGGPVFQGVNSDVAVWRDRSGDVSWLHRFVRYLAAHRALNELAFMSFEHYPFKGCDQGAVLHDDLLREPSLVRGIVASWRADGLPPRVPLLITEGNFASDGGPVAQQLAGALWWADYIGTALSAGVARVYHYQYEAEPLGRQRKCGLYGNYGMFITDARYRIRARAAQFYAAQLLTQRWLAPVDRAQNIYPVTTSLGSVKPVLTAYAAQRPDRTWALLLVNKDRADHGVRPTFRLSGGTDAHFMGRVETVVFGRRQYGWRGTSPTELPAPDRSPMRQSSYARAGTTYTVPAESIVIVRGPVAP